MDAELRKLAADTIIKLRDEVLEKTSALEILKKAQILAFKLFKNGSIPAEDIEVTIEKFAAKDMNELNLIDKALEFNIQKDQLKFGTLSSNKQYDETIDPLTRYLLEDVL